MFAGVGDEIDVCMPGGTLVGRPICVFIGLFANEDVL